MVHFLTASCFSGDPDADSMLTGHRTACSELSPQSGNGGAEMLRASHRHLIARARVDRQLHHTGGHRRLAGLLAAPLLALLWLMVTSSPASAECTAAQNSTNQFVFNCLSDAYSVGFGTSAGILRHNHGSDPGFADEFDFDSRVTAPGSQHVANDASNNVQVAGNTVDNTVTIGDVASPASQILVSFNFTNPNTGTDQLIIDDTANTTTDKQIVV